MAQNLYVVVNEDKMDIARSGVLGRNIFTRKADAEDVAQKRRHGDYQVYKLSELDT